MSPAPDRKNALALLSNGHLAVLGHAHLPVFDLTLNAPVQHVAGLHGAGLCVVEIIDSGEWAEGINIAAPRAGGTYTVGSMREQSGLGTYEPVFAQDNLYILYDSAIYGARQSWWSHRMHAFTASVSGGRWPVARVSGGIPGRS